MQIYNIFQRNPNGPFWILTFRRPQRHGAAVPAGNLGAVRFRDDCGTGQRELMLPLQAVYVERKGAAARQGAVDGVFIRGECLGWLPSALL